MSWGESVAIGMVLIYLISQTITVRGKLATLQQSHDKLKADFDQREALITTERQRVRRYELATKEFMRIVRLKIQSGLLSVANLSDLDAFWDECMRYAYMRQEESKES